MGVTGGGFLVTGGGLLATGGGFLCHGCDKRDKDLSVR